MAVIARHLQRAQLPAIAGGRPLFPEGVALVRPDLPGTEAVTRRLTGILESGTLTPERVSELLIRFL